MVSRTELWACSSQDELEHTIDCVMPLHIPDEPPVQKRTFPGYQWVDSETYMHLSPRDSDYL